jgi:hypothetical protein
MPSAVFGLAATSRRGFFELASEPVEGQPIAPTTRTHILDGSGGGTPFTEIRVTPANRNCRAPFRQRLQSASLIYRRTT